MDLLAAEIAHIPIFSDFPIKYVSRETTSNISPPLWTFLKNNPHVTKNCQTREKSDSFYGGPEEARTPRLCNANAALYQMSYGPMFFKRSCRASLSIAFAAVE